MGTSSALFSIAAFVLSSSALVTTSSTGDLPNDSVGAVHVYLGRAAGPCRRDDPDVSSVGACGEAFLAADLRLAARWVLNVELGVGFFPASRSGNSDYGTERHTGGPLFLSFRWAAGYDFTRRFFARLGPQLRVAFAFDRPVPGVQLALDLGTRFDRVELGVRSFGGVDGVASTGGAADGPHWRAALSVGVLVFLRFRVA